jgi:hypothetical protein
VKREEKMELPASLLFRVVRSVVDVERQRRKRRRWWRRRRRSQADGGGH